MANNLVYPILEKIEKAGILAVVLDVPFDEIMPENVFGISPSGEIVWQIERDEFLAKNRDNMTYVGITDISADEKKIKCHHFCGLLMIVDITSGKILDTVVAK